jgi:non-ribosomal peptide synthetase component F
VTARGPLRCSKRRPPPPPTIGQPPKMAAKSEAAAAAGSHRSQLSAGGVAADGAHGWCVWWYFERRAAAHPAATALVEVDGTEVSYASLQSQAEELDRLLRHHGVGRGDAVMLVSEVSTFALAALLAVLRVGAVFIPNDPAVPPPKRREFIDMAGVRVVICQSEVPALPSTVCALVSTAPTAPTDDDAPTLQPAARYGREELAAIFFSSGSTGARECACVPQPVIPRLLTPRRFVFGSQGRAASNHHLVRADWLPRLCGHDHGRRDRGARSKACLLERRLLARRYHLVQHVGTGV